MENKFKVSICVSMNDFTNSQGIFLYMSQVTQRNDIERTLIMYFVTLFHAFYKNQNLKNMLLYYFENV